MDYSYFLHSRTKNIWQKIGINRRAGAVVPLFSIHSQSSIGIGEIPDLKLLIDWCKKVGMSIVQLLPLNDVGDDFAPYSSVSTFALDPMYLSLRNLKGINPKEYEDELINLRKQFRPRFGRVNYKIKDAKLNLLWKMFKSDHYANVEFNNYVENNISWLKDYALYKVIRESVPMAKWEEWNQTLKYRELEALNEIEIAYIEKINFHYWLQWQLYLQLKDVKQYASQRGVLIMGDLPFLAARQSADVWAHQNYFRLDYSAGAPPDMYFALGQRWGMPPYNWDSIANDGFEYIKQKLRYAENFYDLYRIDHFVGLFRVWATPVDETVNQSSGYLPEEEYLWEAHGRKIIDEMLNAASMLPCAEDLGTVPACSYHVLNEYCIPGMDFQRYNKSNFMFKGPSEYRINSDAVISTHDSSFFVNWWQFESGTIDEKLFELMCLSSKIDLHHYKYAKSVLFDLELSRHGRLYWNENVTSPEILVNILQPPKEKTNDFVYLYLDSFNEKKKFLSYAGSDNSNELIYKCLQRIHQSASIFSIQLIHEYLTLNEEILGKIGKWNYRINIPGKVSKNNWSLLLPVSLEELLELDINILIKELNLQTYRS